MARPVLIDTDPGIDDALAILMAAASPDLEIKAITTVAGNVGIEAVTANALALASMAGLSVPVGRGAVAPLVVPAHSAASVHGPDGKGGVPFPPSPRPADPRPAPELIKAMADASGGALEVIALGPLTNLALALTAYPSLRTKGIKHIYLMGGSAGFGNHTVAAEFNILADPHAAASVFQAGIPITMCGLDVTNQALMDYPGIQAFRAQGGRMRSLCADLLEVYLKAYQRFGRDSLALHDPVAVAAALVPGIIKAKACRVDIELDGEYTTGKTVVDVLGVTGKPANALVALDLDTKAFWALVSELLGSYD